ncbi:MAG TPA: hypothetical protein VEQ66_14220 [Propionibacteriaceae bacterium]|nr:hypothetical protein [Propionibacteriaceae bacterium]
MRAQTESSLTGKRRLIAGITLGALAISQAVVGVWALLAPGSFYQSFPAAGHAWVALLPPYNEHLVRDVGALSLSVTVLLTAAAVVPTPSLIRVAVTAYTVYAIPHTVFHGLHLEGFPDIDAVAQMTGFAIQLVAATLALLTTLSRTPHPSPLNKV